MNAAQKETARTLRSNLRNDDRIAFSRVAPGLVRRGDSDYYYQIDSYSAPTVYGTINVDGTVA